MTTVFNASEVSRIALAYLLLLLSMLLIAGQFVDHYGYRRVFTAGYGAPAYLKPDLESITASTQQAFGKTI